MAASGFASADSSIRSGSFRARHSSSTAASGASSSGSVMAIPMPLFIGEPGAA
jgi:hypothetical protein